MEFRARVAIYSALYNIRQDWPQVWVLAVLENEHETQNARTHGIRIHVRRRFYADWKLVDDRWFGKATSADARISKEILLCTTTRTSQLTKNTTTTITTQRGQFCALTSTTLTQWYIGTRKIPDVYDDATTSASVGDDDEMIHTHTHTIWWAWSERKQQDSTQLEFPSFAYCSKKSCEPICARPPKKYL